MRLILSFILFFIVHISYAQTSKGTLTGKITDENGLNLAYVSIFLEGTGFGTVTNEQGIYFIKIPVGSYNAKFESIGYLDKTENVLISENNTTTLDLQMKEDYKLLGEIVISGVKVNSGYSSIYFSIRSKNNGAASSF
jgi:hypothetical protein